MSEIPDSVVKVRGKPNMHATDIEERRVESPTTEYAQFRHEVTTGVRDPGMVRVQVNLRELMGGFCRFNGNEAQEKTASRFKALYESSQLGGAKAIDPSKEPVDGGGINPEAIFEIGADARRSYQAVATLLGRVDLRRLEFVIIGEKGPTPYAKWRGFGTDGRACARAKVEVRAIVDKVAVHWKYGVRDEPEGGAA